MYIEKLHISLNVLLQTTLPKYRLIFMCKYLLRHQLIVVATMCKP